MTLQWFRIPKASFISPTILERKGPLRWLNTYYEIDDVHGGIGYGPHIQETYRRINKTMCKTKRSHRAVNRMPKRPEEEYLLTVRQLSFKKANRNQLGKGRQRASQASRPASAKARRETAWFTGDKQFNVAGTANARQRVMGVQAGAVGLARWQQAISPRNSR